MGPSSVGRAGAQSWRICALRSRSCGGLPVGPTGRFGLDPWLRDARTKQTLPAAARLERFVLEQRNLGLAGRIGDSLASRALVCLSDQVASLEGDIMAYEYTPPKYAQVIEELRQRIDSGEYPPGSLLPSEHQLTEEFGIARPTVVRALRVLRQDGWIETQQGKGSFVRGRPALAGLESARHGQVELDRDEAREAGEPVETGMVKPPVRIAALLDAAPDEALLCRRRLIRQDGEPSEIITWWIPAQLAESTDLVRPEPLTGGRTGAPGPPQEPADRSRAGAGYRPASHGR